MDPVTHAIIGASIAKATGNAVSFSDAATAAIVVGAVFPDIDILFRKWGDYVYLKNHRGITHSVLGLTASALLIGFVMSFIYNTGFFELFLWSFLGCISHSLFDIFNSYGTKLLWPFIKKKYSLRLMILFDPIMILIMGGYILSGRDSEQFFINAFVLYMMFRVMMRLYAKGRLVRKFGREAGKINVMPSANGVFKWHFILQTDDYDIVGETNFLRRGIREIEKLDRLEDEVSEKALYTPLGKFFSEFTPHFHISCEKDDGIERYIFTDMRYYMRDDFLHHAVLEMDENDSIIKSNFNPYSMKRNVEV